MSSMLHSTLVPKQYVATAQGRDSLNTHLLLIDNAKITLLPSN